MSISYTFNPFTSNFDAIDVASAFWSDPVASKTALDLITTDTDGTVRLTKDTNFAYRWNSTGTAWQFVGLIAPQTFGSSPNNNGISVSSTNALTLQPADATHPGGITAGAQTIGGAKTFGSAVYANGGVDTSSPGTLALGTLNATTINIGNAGATVNIQGTVITETTSTLNVTNPVFTVNSGGAAGSGSNSGMQVNENSVITGYVETSADRNSWILKAPNTAGVATITPGVSGITLNQSSHDPLTLTAAGSSPNANGASLSSQALTLQPADGTNPGILNAGVQTIGGNKTFTGNAFFSTTNTGIDSASNIVLNVGQTNASTINIGRTASSTNLNGVTSVAAAGTLALNQVTATRPLKVDGSKFVTSGTIALASTNDVSGTLPVANGGTNSIATLNNNRVMQSFGGAIVEAAAITASRALASDANGIPVASTTSTTELNYVTGVTSAIQTQINSKVTASAGDINETSFSGANNQVAAANVTGLAFANATVRAFDAQVSVYINATSSLYESFQLHGIQKGASWNMSQTSVGDASGYVFSITNAGQVQYTSPNSAGFVAAALRFRALTLSV